VRALVKSRQSRGTFCEPSSSVSPELVSPSPLA
jgi:hypothetical protein